MPALITVGARLTGCRQWRQRRQQLHDSAGRVDPQPLGAGLPEPPHRQPDQSVLRLQQEPAGEPALRRRCRGRIVCGLDPVPPIVFLYQPPVPVCGQLVAAAGGDQGADAGDGDVSHRRSDLQQGVLFAGAAADTGGHVRACGRRALAVGAGCDAAGRGAGFHRHRHPVGVAGGRPERRAYHLQPVLDAHVALRTVKVDANGAPEVGRPVAVAMIDPVEEHAPFGTQFLAIRYRAARNQRGAVGQANFYRRGRRAVSAGGVLPPAGRHHLPPAAPACAFRERGGERRTLRVDLDPQMVAFQNEAAIVPFAPAGDGTRREVQHAGDTALRRERRRNDGVHQHPARAAVGPRRVDPALGGGPDAAGLQPAGQCPRELPAGQGNAEGHRHARRGRSGARRVDDLDRYRHLLSCAGGEGGGRGIGANGDIQGTSVRLARDTGGDHLAPVVAARQALQRQDVELRQPLGT